MKIQVTQTRKASPNGFEVIEYKEGEVYEMPESLANTFIQQNWGKEEGVTVEEKAVNPVENNKMIVPSNNKSAKKLLIRARNKKNEK